MLCVFTGVDADEDEDTGEVDYTGEDPVVWFLEHYPMIMNRQPSFFNGRGFPLQ